MNIVANEDSYVAVKQSYLTELMDKIADKLDYSTNSSVIMLIGFMFSIIVLSIFFYKYKKAIYDDDKKLAKKFVRNGIILYAIIHIFSFLLAMLVLTPSVRIDKIVEYKTGFKSVEITERIGFIPQTVKYGYKKIYYGMIPYIGYGVATVLILSSIFLLIDIKKNNASKEDEIIKKRKKDTFRTIVVGFLFIILTLIVDLITTSHFEYFVH